MPLPKLLLFNHSCMYAKRGGVAAYRIVWIGLCSAPLILNRLTPNDPYLGRTAPLTSKLYISYIYSTNTGTEYFKHALYSPFFFSSKCSLFHNANLFGLYYSHFIYRVC